MAGTAPHIPGCRDLSLIGERVARSLFTAHSDRVGGTVTVTVFPPLSDGRTRAGFDEAAETAQRLGAHPSVLTIHEWGHADDGRPWIVTDPQPAESVDTLLTLDGPLDVERSLQVGILLAGALETAHRAGIVHGDLQPDRIVFGAHGEPLLVETGLAGFAVFPGLGALNNPVRYHSPPEVLERTEVSPATDVYSLATTVYALLSGRAPHQKPAEITDSNASLLLRILQMSVPPIERPDLPPGLEDALRGPLSATPGKRPQQAIEVAWLLQDVQRRAGLAVTEPVVFDLDDLTSPSGSRATAPGPAAGAVAPPTEPAAPPASLASPAPPFPPPVVPDVEVPQPPAAGWAEEAPRHAATDWKVEAPQPPAAPDWTVEAPQPPAGPDWTVEAPQPPAGPDWTVEAPQPPAAPDPAADTPQPAAADWTANPPRHAAPDWGEDAPRHAAAGWTFEAPQQPADIDPAVGAPPHPAAPEWQAEAPPPAGSPWSALSAGQADADGLWAPADRPDGSPGVAIGDAATPASLPGGDAAPGPTPAGAGGGPPAPWDPSAAAGEPPETLWPHQWPAETAAPDELPPWAVATSGDSGGDAPAPDRPRPANGDLSPRLPDAGPQAPQASPQPAPGPGPDAGGAPPPSFAPPSRPPELDELPAWYTAPLPNQHNGGPAPADANGSTNGAGGTGAGGPGASVFPDQPAGANGLAGGANGAFPGAPSTGSGVDAPRQPLARRTPGASGLGRPHGPAGGAVPADPAAPWPAQPAAPTPPTPSGGASSHLPGAGDELRSLFGEVVGDPGEAAPSPALPPSSPVADFGLDPLGPPEQRPPIDLDSLNRPLGPAPYLPPSARGSGDGSAAPTARLPSRDEAPTTASADVGPSRLPRAGEADGAGKARPARPGPRQVAGVPADSATDAGGARVSTGPPALPVVILIVVVILLALGAVWLVLTDDDAGAPATDQNPTPTADATPG